MSNFDFGALPPEINSGRMYTGAGSGPLVVASSAWDGLATALSSAASAYQYMRGILEAASTGRFRVGSGGVTIALFGRNLYGVNAPGGANFDPLISIGFVSLGAGVGFSVVPPNW